MGVLRHARHAAGAWSRTGRGVTFMVQSRKGPALASVSRRTVLGGLATPLLPASPAATAAGSADPVLPLWTDWIRLSEDAAALASQWAALEAGLARELGFPRVAVPAPDGGAPTWVTTHADLDAALAAQVARNLGPQLHADLARRLA